MLSEERAKEVKTLTTDIFRRYISWEDDPLPKTNEELEEMVCEVVGIVVGVLENPPTSD